MTMKAKGMKKHLASLLAALFFASPAVAQTINNLGAGAAVSGTDMYPTYQGANPAKRVTAAQINTYIQSLWGAGCATFLTTPSSANLRGCLTDEVGSGAFYTVGGALGTPASATLTNGTGLPISTGLTGAGTGVLTALGVNVGSAGAPVLFNGAGGTPSSLVLTNATGLPLAQLTGAGTGVLSALAAAMNSSTGPIGALTATNGNCVVGNGSAWTSTTCPGGTISAVPSVQTGTNYAIVDGDRAKVIYLSNASAQTPTLPSAATLTSSNGWFVTICNIAAGIQTVTPTTSTIGGAASLAIPGGSAARPVCWNAVSDGTNYSLVPAGNNSTIFSGTAALGTSAIGSAACATAVTTSAPGVLTTDVVLASFNGDPTAVTGYVPLTAGMLTIIVYPTANNVVAKVCNNTSSSVTPGAITLNLRVTR